MTKQDEDDDLFTRACRDVRKHDRASNTFLQAQFGIGTGRARKLLARMEAAGVISAADDKGGRSVVPLPPIPPLLKQSGELAEAADRAAKAGDDVAFVALATGAAQTLELHRVLNPTPTPTPTDKGSMKMGDVTDDEDRFGNGIPKNVQAPGSNLVSGEELRTIFERIENVRSDKKKLGDVEKEIFAELKSRGYDAAVVRYILKRRTLKPDQLAEFEAVTELYMAAVGMLSEPPLFRAVAGMGVDPTVRESVVAALKMIAPMNGEITIREGTGPRLRIIRDKDGVRVEEVAEAAPGALSGLPGSPAAGATPPPEGDDDAAFLLGKEARKEDVPVVKNPFPFGDARRRHWDEGWREQDGGDGFGGGDE